jgi:primosomal protein N' (replication factor Y)
VSERVTYFADVLLPVPIHQVFTYLIPFELNEHVQAGLRVIVPFGKNKLLTGIVTRVHEEIPAVYQAKYILHLLDEQPIITPKQLQFWDWISTYYMAPIGDVMNAALPANFKLASETKIRLHPEFDVAHDQLSERERTVVEVLEMRDQLSLKELSDVLGIKTIQPLVKAMIEKHIVSSTEEINDRYVPKTILCVSLHETYLEETTLNAFLQELESTARAQKQVDALIQFIKLAMEQGGMTQAIPKKQLLEQQVSASALSTLEKRGVFVLERFQIDRLTGLSNELRGFKPLTEAQQKALLEVEASFEQKQVTLLHGVTGSGKTELYVQLIQSYLDQGKQILFLLPEIALTTQLIQRLSAYFGEQVGVYHSKFNQNERVEIWNHVLHNDPNKYRIILGARSAVFLPFQDLGFIIVDEEHESSFKQYDPSPRYHARDAAIVLGSLHKAHVLLGTATPALETYYNAKQGKFGLVELNERYKGLQLPEIWCADLKRERKLKNMQSHFTPMILEEMQKALDQGEQVMLFQNRRGYTPLWSCEVCNWTPKCTNCDVSLTYHKHSNLLKCHYCSYTTAPIGSCPACGSNRLQMLGFGTEKIEDELSLMFPNKVVKRLDLDTTRSKHAYEEIIEEFEQRRIDILIGTQMITKGLDFDHVSMVGILDADMLLNRPDFRAYERSYQLMSQVAGRAGRKEKRGKVIIQTGNPDHWVIQLVQEHNYKEFYAQEVIERQQFFYPPFYKMIQLTLKHTNEQMVHAASIELADQLKEVFKERVLGPEFPIIKRIQNYYLKEIKLKIERSAPERKVKEKMREMIDQFYAKPANKSVKMVIDVDPL